MGTPLFPLLENASIVFFQLLQTLRSSSLMDEFRVGELFNKFYGELALKTRIPDTGEMQLSWFLFFSPVISTTY